MITLSLDNAENSALKFIRDWVQLLVKGKYNEACESLDLRFNKYDISPEQLKNIVVEYCRTETPVIKSELDLSKERIDFYYFNDTSGFTVDYDLSIHSELEDLTVQFSFKKVSDSIYKIHFDDLHVL